MREDFHQNSEVIYKTIFVKIPSKNHFCKNSLLSFLPLDTGSFYRKWNEKTFWNVKSDVSIY